MVKFLPGFVIVYKNALNAGGDSLDTPCSFFNPSGSHTTMLSFDNAHGSYGLEIEAEGLSNRITYVLL
jgi:hypothetical protein